MKVNRDKMTKEFLVAFEQQRGRHVEEILWNGSQDTERGFKLLETHTRENIELGKKFGVIE